MSYIIQLKSEILVGTKTLAVQPGNWSVQVIRNTRGKVTSVTAWHIDSAIERLSLPYEIKSAGFLPFIITTDNHTFGYLTPGSIPQPDGKSFQILPNGVLINCGFEDLQTRGIKDSGGNIIALSTSFIPETIIEVDDVDDSEDEETEEEEL